MAASQDDRLLAEQIDGYCAHASEYDEWLLPQGSSRRRPRHAFALPLRLSAERVPIRWQTARQLTPRYFLCDARRPLWLRWRRRDGYVTA